ncbi:MAG: hypothetical protein QMC74_04655, partial [Myxococcota bacterium]
MASHDAIDEVEEAAEYQQQPAKSQLSRRKSEPRRARDNGPKDRQQIGIQRPPKQEREERMDPPVDPVAKILFDHAIEFTAAESGTRRLSATRSGPDQEKDDPPSLLLRSSLSV